MKKLLLVFTLLMSCFAFANEDLGPKTIMMDVSSYPDEYLALTAKEACQGSEGIHNAQIRASKLCYAWGHIMAVRGGFVMEDNVELDYMLKVSRRDAYDFIEVDTELYECKKKLKHKKMLRPWKFVKINCLTE